MSDDLTDGIRLTFGKDERDALIAALQQQLADRDAEIKRLRGLEAMQRVLSWGGHEMPRPDVYARNMHCLASVREALTEACDMALELGQIHLDPNREEYATWVELIDDLRKRGRV